MDVLQTSIKHRPDDIALHKAQREILRSDAENGTRSDLEAVLRSLRDEDGTRADVEAALRTAIVYLPHSARDDEGELTLSVVPTDDGNAVAIYSSPERLVESLGEGTPHLAVPFMDLTTSWPPGVRAVIDPGSEWSFPVPQNLLRA